MSSHSIEELVEQFVARREAEPDLDAERFASEHAGGDPRLLAALHRAVDVLAALEDDVAGAAPQGAGIGDYRIVRELGRGGMGVVYEVERDGRRFALKRLLAPLLAQPHARQRLQREAEALQRVDHPGVVRLVATGEAGGIPHLVMDLVVGRPLADLAPLPWPQAATFARAIGRALTAVHATGLCHRDLKPQNVLVGGDGNPVLIDFGLAHDDAALSLTGAGDLLGTPRYLAPEQAGGGKVDARTDVFALGLVLAELLTGAPVRRGDDRAVLLRQALRGARPALPRGTPVGLRRIVERALMRRPADRFASAAAMADQLDRLLGGAPVTARGAAWHVPVREWLSFHPRLAGGFAVLAAGLVVAAVLATASWREQVAAASMRQGLEAAVVAWLAGDVTACTDAVAAVRVLAPHDPSAACLQRLLHDRGAATPAPSALPAALQQALDDRAAGRWTAAAAALASLPPDATFLPLLHVLEAEAFGKAGDRERAVAAMVAAAGLLPDTAAMHAAVGDARLAARDARGAVADHRRAVALDPRSWRLRLQLAKSLYAVDAADGLAQIAAARDLLGAERPASFPELLNLEASLLDKSGRPEAALPLLRELVALRPEQPRYVYNLAYALDRLHAIGEAKGLYERALELDPANERAALCLVWLLATAADPHGDLAAAETLLLRTLQNDGGRSEAVLQMVREFGLRTRRIDTLGEQLEQLAGRTGTPPNVQAALRHTRAFLVNAVRGDGR